MEMEFDEKSVDLLDAVRDLNEALATFLIAYGQNTSNSDVNRARKYLKEAYAILSPFGLPALIPPMYGAPEVSYSKKKEAEEKLKQELFTIIDEKRLLATQWKEIVKQIIDRIPESREAIGQIIC